MHIGSGREGRAVEGGSQVQGGRKGVRGGRRQESRDRKRPKEKSLREERMRGGGKGRRGKGLGGKRNEKNREKEYLS